MEFMHEVFVNVNPSVQPQNFVKWVLLECFMVHFSDSAIEACTDYLWPCLKFQRELGNFFQVPWYESRRAHGKTHQPSSEAVCLKLKK